MAITRSVITEFQVNVEHEHTINSGTTSSCNQSIVQLTMHPNSTHYECHRQYPYQDDAQNRHIQTPITGLTIELQLFREGDDYNYSFAKFFELLASLEVSHLKMMEISVKIFDGVIHNIAKYNQLLHVTNYTYNNAINMWVMSVKLIVSSVILYSDEYSTEFDHMVPATQSSIANLERRTLLNSSENLECSICLEKINEGYTVTRMPCMHEFHENCIVRWLNTSHYCPLRRFIMPM